MYTLGVVIPKGDSPKPQESQYNSVKGPGTLRLLSTVVDIARDHHPKCARAILDLPADRMLCFYA